MADYVDGLVIEVEANASEAVDQLARLEERLASLKRATNRSGTISTYADHITKLNQAISGMGVISAEKISNLVHFTEAMTGLQSVKFSSTMGNNINKLTETLRGIDGEVLTKFELFVDAMDYLREIKDVKYPSSINTGLKKTVDILKDLDTVNIAKFKEFTSAIAQLGQLSGFKGGDLSSMATSMKRISTETHKATQRGRTFNTVLANIRVNTVMLLGAWHKVNRLVTSSLSEYGDYIETLNLFQVSMENTGGAMYEFAEKAQDLLGIDLTQWMKAQGVFMSLGKGFGIATERASVMSQQLTQLAYDISSFYNISVADAVQKVQSAFSGELEPVRRLGFDLSQARLQTIALSMGIDKNVSSMTQAEKANLRYIALLTQVTDLQGDLARTIESPTNQMRILNAQFQQMQRSIGLLLLPMLNKVLPYLNAILRVIKMIAEETASMFGYTLPKLSGSGDFGMGIIDGGEDMADVLEEANGKANELKNTLASFDEINLITSSKSGGGVGDALQDLSSAWDYELPTYDFLGDATENKAKQIADDMMKALRPAIDFIKGAIEWVQDNIDLIKATILLIAGEAVIGKLINKFKTLGDHVYGIEDTMSGIAIMTVGLALNFNAGESLADGKTLQGLIEGALGTAVTAIGGYMAFGLTGLAISIPLSITAILAGFIIGKNENTRKEIQDFFYRFRDGRVYIDDVVESWEKFTQSLVDNELIKKIDEVSDFASRVETTSDNLNILRQNYITGNIELAQYVAGANALWTQMEENIRAHAQGITDTIRTALNGELGDFLEMMGVSVKRVDEALTNVDANMSAKITAITGQMQMYTMMLEQGAITQEQYDQHIQETLDAYDQMGIKMNGLAPIASEFVNSFSDLKINTKKLDQTIDAIDRINQAYDDAHSEIAKSRKALMDDYTIALQNATGEDRKVIEEAMKMTDLYYDNQFRKLDEGYQSLMESIQGTYLVDWNESLDEKGLRKTVDAVGNDMLKVDEYISEAFDERHIEKVENTFTTVTGLISDYKDDITKAFSEVSRVPDLTGAYNDNIAQINDEIDAGYTARFLSIGDKNEKIESSQKEHVKNWIELQNEWTSELKKTTNVADEETGKTAEVVEGNFKRLSAVKYIEPMFVRMAKGIADTAPNFAKATSDIVREIAGVFEDPSEVTKRGLIKMLDMDVNMMKSPAELTEFKRSADMMMYEMEKSFSDPDGVLGRTLQNTIDGVTDINPAIMRDKGTELKDNLLAGLTGSAGVEEATGSFKDMLFGGLDGNEAENFGRKLGQGIADGLDGTSGETEQAVKSVIKGMSAPFNQFGSDLYDFMTGLTEGVAEIWNGLTISTGKASFYNNGVRRWKMRGYASGGFPDSADFFYANENGVPEYVGSMGGRTAVANNTEIIDGVSDGVYRALRDSGIITDVKKIASKDGKVVFAPSEDAGRVMKQSVNMYNSTGGRY